MTDYTIASGTLMPGYTPVSYQLLYDDSQTQRAVKMLAALNEYAVTPYPDVSLTTEQQTRLSQIWSQLGEFADTAMARFVVGDYKLTDETWASFCEEAERRGLSEMVSIWQDAVR